MGHPAVDGSLTAPCPYHHFCGVYRVQARSKQRRLRAMGPCAWNLIQRWATGWSIWSSRARSQAADLRGTRFRLSAASHSAAVVRHFSGKVSAVRNLPSRSASRGQHHRAANRFRTSCPRVGGTGRRRLGPPDGWRATGWL